MESGIEKCAMLIIKSRKQQITEAIELSDPGKNQSAWRKGNWQIFGDI